MNYYGKFFGGLFGLLFAGLPGMILGIIVGHYFDKGLALNTSFWGPNVQLSKKVFFKSTFMIMGYIAKADGRVSEAEIEAARTVMRNLQLSKNERLSAIHYYNQGKEQKFKFDELIDIFVRNCGRQRQLIQLFVEIQIKAAFVDGAPNYYQRRLLEILCDKLKVSRSMIDQLGKVYGYRYRYHHEQAYQGYNQQQRQYTPPPRQAIDELANAYFLLGAKASDTDSDIKKKYRKLMSENHPDKLVAKGLPDAMLKAATEKTQRIRKAYETIAAARGVK